MGGWEQVELHLHLHFQVCYRLRPWFPNMNLKELFAEDRGVSPVIGVILMVAITVILAAVIGAFVLQIGGDLGESAPQASISISDTNADENTIELRHGGGDTIEWDETRLVVEHDDDTLRWNSPNDDSFATSDRVTINTSNEDDSIDGIGTEDEEEEEVATLNTSTQTTLEDDDEASPLGSDNRVTVTMIDRPSGEIIFERTVRV